MPRPIRPTYGFTLVELAVVLAIIGVITAAAALSLSRARPRADLASAAAELHAVLHGARARALASGNDVAVMVFPNHDLGNERLGRVIVYEDGDFSLFDAAAPVNLDGYDPALPAHGPRSEVVSVVDLPRRTRVGPATGLGAPLAAPYATVRVDSDCTFCAGAGAARRGAVVFDAAGAARFQSAAGAPLDVDGGSVSLTALDLAGPPVRTLVIGAANGSLRAVGIR